MLQIMTWQLMAANCHGNKTHFPTPAVFLELSSQKNSDLSEQAMERFDTVNRTQTNSDISQPSAQSDRTKSELTNKTKIRLNTTWLTV